jgi:hypothetical protein
MISAVEMVVPKGIIINGFSIVAELWTSMGNALGVSSVEVL